MGRLLSNAARPDQVSLEIERCEVVCVNCHRRRTAGRAGSFRATGVPSSSSTPRQRRNYEFVLETLRSSGCVDCGEDGPIVLDFDHRGEKRGAVTRLAMQGYSLATLASEIGRCEIRCANCHRVRTLTATRCWRADGHWALGLHDP